MARSFHFYFRPFADSLVWVAKTLSKMKALFFHPHLLRSPKRAWGLASLFALYILVSALFALPVARCLAGYHLLGALLVALLALLLFYLVAYFIFLGIRNTLAYLGIAGLLLIAFLLMQAMVTTAEKIHLLEYSLLALFFYKACRFHFQGVLLFGIPWLLTTGVSWVDELWQGILPERVYDIQDVLFNTLGGMLGLGVAWIRRRYAP